MRPILIVDADPDYRDHLYAALTREGAEVRVVASSRAALAVLKHEPIGGIITDIMMPDMDGIELVRAVRRQYGRLPVLVLSTSETEVVDIYLKAAVVVGATLTGLKGAGDLDLVRELFGIVDFRDQVERRASRA